jgi:ribosomal protein S18 acetylase RimI-like enzyme
MKLQKFQKLTNINKLSKIIFLNFIELMNQDNIVFSIDDIERLLISQNMTGWFLLDDNENIIGYLIGEKQNTNDGRFLFFICYLYIIEEKRNKGYSKILLLNCLKFVKENNLYFTMIITKNNSIGNKLLEKYSFTKDPFIKIDNENYSLLLNYTF